jgi:hypothetical protein
VSGRVPDAELTAALLARVDRLETALRLQCEVVDRLRSDVVAIDGALETAAAELIKLRLIASGRS